MRNYFYIISTLVALMVFHVVNAQQPLYITAGRIEFEQKVNVYARLGSDDNNGNNEFTELYKKTHPQFRVTYHDLLFHNDSSLYKPGRENTEANGEGSGVGEKNVVYTDLAQSRQITLREVFDEKYLIKDSTRNIKWKITNETREIAGFECRRANAVIFDSIYVVAFYTDAIISAGGPESFCGLPGMILGVALPHDHVSWFATKVYLEPVPLSTLTPPAKGKVATAKDMQGELQKRFKDWGKEGQKYILAAML